VRTHPDDPQPGASVTPLERPPVRQSVNIRSELGHTFQTFVNRMRAWWPVEPFSAGKQRVEQITVEQRQGGRVYETWDDGTVVDWGELLVWDPPNRFVMTWSETPRPTEVEIAFTGLGPAVTRVTIVHRGWEKLTEEELQRDCALPGGYRSGGYSVGWRQILDCLATALDGRP
jgi:Activator of Hsp90 ATPase homolog 1-like protein